VALTVVLGMARFAAIVLEMLRAKTFVAKALAYLQGVLVGSKDIIGFLVILQFELQVLDDFISVLDFHFGGLDDPSHVFLLLHEILDGRQILRSRGPLQEELLKLIKLSLHTVNLLLMGALQQHELLVQVRRKLDVLLDFLFNAELALLCLLL